MGISTTLFCKLEEIFEISLLLALASLICCSNHDFGTLAYLWDIIIVPLTNTWSVLSFAMACQCPGSSFTWWSQSHMTANTTQPGLCLLCPLHAEPIFISSMFQISNSTPCCEWLSFSDNVCNSSAILKLYFYICRKNCIQIWFAVTTQLMQRQQLTPDHEVGRTPRWPQLCNSKPLFCSIGLEKP